MEATQPGADHPNASGNRRDGGRAKDDQSWVPDLGGEQIDVSAQAAAVSGDECLGSQIIGGREEQGVLQLHAGLA